MPAIISTLKHIVGEAGLMRGMTALTQVVHGRIPMMTDQVWESTVRMAPVRLPKKQPQKDWRSLFSASILLSNYLSLPITKWVNRGGSRNQCICLQVPRTISLYRGKMHLQKLQKHLADCKHLMKQLFILREEQAMRLLSFTSFLYANLERIIFLIAAICAMKAVVLRSQNHWVSGKAQLSWKIYIRLR